jgi:hypothetical protein
MRRHVPDRTHWPPNPQQLVRGPGPRHKWASRAICTFYEGYEETPAEHREPSGRTGARRGGNATGWV